MAMPKKPRQHQGERITTADSLYEQFGKPLEADHLGEFVAISPDGRTLVGENLTELVRDAADAFGPENYIFRIGPRTVGSWR